MAGSGPVDLEWEACLKRCAMHGRQHGEVSGEVTVPAQKKLRLQTTQTSHLYTQWTETKREDFLLRRRDMDRVTPWPKSTERADFLLKRQAMDRDETTCIRQFQEWRMSTKGGA